jgi:aminoglycoside 6'-N-acetyltransferase I
MPCGACDVERRERHAPPVQRREQRLLPLGMLVEHNQIRSRCHHESSETGIVSQSAAMIRVRPATPAQAGDWLRMRQALWPEDDDPSHGDEIERFFAGALRNPLHVLLASDGSGAVIGFAELSIRSYAEACTTDRVAYLEGWYVEPGSRLRGVGRALVQAAEDWARSQGCAEFGSDAVITNEASAAAHRALGFVEMAQIRCFLKALC